ncbi:MAG: GAF domain-containing protein [Acidobacteriota bacterium]
MNICEKIVSIFADTASLEVIAEVGVTPSDNGELLALAASLQRKRLSLEDQTNTVREALAQGDDQRALALLLKTEKTALLELLLAMQASSSYMQQQIAHMKQQLANIDVINRRFLEQQMSSNNRRTSTGTLLQQEFHSLLLLDRHEVLAIIHEKIANAAQHHNFNLTNLYIASCQLHESLDEQKVIESIFEIVHNFIGSEEVAIFRMNDDRSALTLLAGHGIDVKLYQQIPLGTGLIGNVAAQAEAYFLGQPDDARLPSEAYLSACIPLIIFDQVIGAIAIFQLLSQKALFEELDHQLFTLLSTHASIAFYGAELHAKAMAAQLQSSPVS